MKLLLVCTAVLVVAGRAPAQQPGEQAPQAFVGKITRTVSLRYLLYLPKDYRPHSRARWPLILFLHGAGERGDDVEKVKAHGPPKLIAQGQEFPFIIVSPQCPENEFWDIDALSALLDQVIRKYRVDRGRVYLTGLSMGGFGTWALAAAHPDRFAAIAPICGGGDPRQAARIKDVPVWAFHGAKDPVVPIKADQDMVDALKAAGGDVRFTVYPDAEHDAWTRTYDNPELFQWLLQHRRPSRR